MPKRRLHGESSPPKRNARVAEGASELRGVPLPEGWTSVDSLLVWAQGEPQPSRSIACFDFDGCLAATSVTNQDPDAWRMMYPHVPCVLKTLHASGHKIVIVTNESMDRLKKPEAIRKTIVKKTTRLAAFARETGVPMQVCMSLRCSCSVATTRSSPA